MCGSLPAFLNFMMIMTHNADDIIETSNSGSKKIIEDCIASSENLPPDGTTNVVEVTANDASSSKNNLSFGYSSTKVVIEDHAELSGFNKDLAGSNVFGTHSSSVEVYHSHASK